MYGLRVVIADVDPGFRKYLKDKLNNAGFMVVAEASDGRKVLQDAFNTQPHLVILGDRLANSSGLETAKAIEEHGVAPVLLLADPKRHNEIIEALDHWLISYILKPIDETNLYPAIEVAVATFKKMCLLEQENRRLKQSLETRKVVERAKGLLIEFRGMTEKQAFRHIQKVSMDKCVPIQNVAQQIVKNLENQRINESDYDNVR